jgi:hypothetical protein
MSDTDFAGKNGFVWWVGIVEAREDPLKVGRLRVRIIGWHTDNKAELPTDKLPWASILLPTNGATAFTVPKEGEWVMGFFMDGKEGQQPVVIGVFPGIVSDTRREVTSSTDVVNALKDELNTQRAKLDDLVKKKNTLVASRPESALDRVQKSVELKDIDKLIEEQRRLVKSLEERVAQYNAINEAQPPSGFTDPRSQAKINEGPREPVYSRDGVVNEPSVPRIARGEVNGTVYIETNKRREHVCDISNELKGISDWAKVMLTKLGELIRFIVNGVTSAMNLDPSGSLKKITETLRKFNRILREIRDFLKMVNAALNVITTIVRYIRAMIDYILSLPAKLLAFLRKCLSEFLGALARIFSDMFGSLGFGGSDFGALVSEVRETISVTSEIITETVKIISFPAQLLVAFVTPTTEAEQQEALAYFKGLVTNNTAEANKVAAAAPAPVANNSEAGVRGP